MKRKQLAYPFVIWVALFTVIPLCLIFYYAFVELNSTGDYTFTLAYLKKCFDPLYVKVFAKSIWLALISTVFCLVIGYPAAYILSRLQTQSNIWIMLIVLPMWMNFLLRTYSWLSLLEKNGILNNFIGMLGFNFRINILYTEYAVVLGMVYNFLPFMILPIYTVLKKMDQHIIEAAHDLGANKIVVFRKVIFPLSLSGVISGIAMVFMPAVTTFVVPSILGGNQVRLIGNVIEQQFLQADNWYFGSSLSIVLMVIILLSMGIITKYEKEEGGVGGLW
ncbi:ABC transporter permease [Vallitalea okinawensis]|uniref:ABC transporter permease n=1 Tax=Vallitalea okinawensis TaxID=2078660 RepID=UPI000CFAA524|nr:ABC transporter permease [Vallitalea okinawensis]